MSTKFSITKWSQDQCTRDNISKREIKDCIQYIRNMCIKREKKQHM